jgi:hypothetical protein
VRVGVSVKYLNTEFFISLPTFFVAPDSSSLPACRQACALGCRFLARPQNTE